MSSYAGRCLYCGKDVMHKTFFGTLHVCITDEEREFIDKRDYQVSAHYSNPLKSLLKNNPAATQAANLVTNNRGKKDTK